MTSPGSWSQPSAAALKGLSGPTGEWFLQNADAMVKHHQQQLSYWKNIQQTLAQRGISASVAVVPSEHKTLSVPTKTRRPLPAGNPPTNKPPKPSAPKPGSSKPKRPLPAGNPPPSASKPAKPSGMPPMPTQSKKPAKPAGMPPMPKQSKPPKPSGMPPLPNNAAKTPNPASIMRKAHMMHRQPSDVEQAPKHAVPVQKSPRAGPPPMPNHGNKAPVKKGPPPIPTGAAAANARPASSPATGGVLCKAKVLHNFEANNDTSLSVKAHSVVDVLEKTDEWWKVRDHQGHVGYVPANYVAELGVERVSISQTTASGRKKPVGAVNIMGMMGGGGGLAAKLAARRQAAQSPSHSNNNKAAAASAVSPSPRKQKPPPPSGVHPSSPAAAKPKKQPPATAVTKPTFSTAKFDYTSSDPNDLQFTAGAIVRVLTLDDKGWMTGEHKGKRGSFPTARVELLPASAKVARAKWDFQADDDTKVSFDPKDYLLITDDSNDEWWMATINKKSGYIPAAYVEKIV